MNELILMQTATPQGKSIKQSTLGSGGQRSRSHGVETQICRPVGSIILALLGRVALRASP